MRRRSPYASQTPPGSMCLLHRRTRSSSQRMKLLELSTHQVQRPHSGPPQPFGSRMPLARPETGCRSPDRRPSPVRTARSACLRPCPFPPTGRITRKRLPRPGVLSTSTRPPWSATMPWLTANPRPVPWPTGLVVKNGSKIRGRIAAGMPVSGTGGPCSKSYRTKRYSHWHHSFF